MKAKRLIQTITMLFLRNGRKRAAWLKKHQILGGIGENCYWGPTLMPVYPELIKLHNNIVVHGKAKLVPHDMVNVFLKRAVPGEDFGYDERLGCIEIMDNVYIATASRIMPNVRIGKNCIISAGSVVTQDVPENSVVAGNPAKVIGRFDMFVASRLMNKGRSYDFKNQQLPPEIAAAEWDFFMKSRQTTAYQDTSNAANAEATDAGIDAKVDVAVREKIIKVLSEGISGIDFEKETQLVTSGIFDSLSLITVVSLLEEAFSCKIPFEKVNADNFNSASRMVLLIQEVQKQTPPPTPPLKRRGAAVAFKRIGRPDCL